MIYFVIIFVMMKGELETFGHSAQAFESGAAQKTLGRRPNPA
jgi:hypothetical protein